MNSATILLDKEWTQDDLDQAAARIAAPLSQAVAPRALQSFLILRVATEWLALSSSVVDEVATVRSSHRLPHRTGIVEGIVNVRGELVTLVSLATVLGFEHSTDITPVAGRRLLVLQRDGLRVASRVEEVSGVDRFAADALQPAPSTISRASRIYTRGLLPVGGRQLAALDDQLLFYTIAKELL